MANEPSTRRYRYWYAKLLRFYPKPYRERFGEGMEQTFNDLLCECATEGKGLFEGAAWMFAETFAGIIKENVMMRKKNLIRIAVATGVLLLIPLVAMQFTHEVAWTLADFIVAGILLFGAGLTYELISRNAHTSAYRLAAGVAVASALMLVWVNLAVGIIGSEHNPANLMYVGVLAIGLIGASIARLQPNGMSHALFAMAIAQAIVPLVALIIWGSGVTSDEASVGLLNVFAANALFVLLFAGSAFLFRRANTLNT